MWIKKNLWIGLAWIGVSTANPVSHLSNLLNHYQTYQAVFVQQTVDPKEGVIANAKGLLFLQKPGRFRWETNEPMHQIIVTNHDQMWIYNQDLAQATVQKLSPSANNPAALLTNSVNQLLQHYTVIEKSHYFQLTPKQQENDFVAVNLYFTHQALSQLEVINTLGQKNIYRFSKVKINQRLPAHLFEFHPQQGVDVVRQ